MLYFLAAATTLSLQPADEQAPPAPPKCDTAEHRQFDFWVGEWNVVDNETGEHAGNSHIELLYGGCVLRENWTSPGFRGGSINMFSRRDGKWHQTWMDQMGALRHFIGGVNDQNQMVITHIVETPNGTVHIRLTFTANDDGTVRQYSDFSRDDGTSWQTRYDYLYQPLSN